VQHKQKGRANNPDGEVTKQSRRIDKRQVSEGKKINDRGQKKESIGRNTGKRET